MIFGELDCKRFSASRLKTNEQPLPPKRNQRTADLMNVRRIFEDKDYGYL
ncbi:MAG: hypothetical protein H0X15_02480 [Acidobacteria bacterium]|jgi:hypothetical protein|nr:hypothetical protein [Acidobacteriota bacterium]MBA4124065.1 hypothetical protein [Acidobacteriota bacterium]